MCRRARSSRRRARFATIIAALMPHDRAGRAQPGRLAFLALSGLASLSGPATASAAPPSGEAIYAKRCAVCHDRPGETRAPARSVLENLTVERILAVSNTGTMKPQASALSDTERKALAAFLSSKHGSADAAPAAMIGQCPAGQPFSIPNDDKQWSGWGADPRNSRSQQAKAA